MIVSQEYEDSDSDESVDESQSKTEVVSVSENDNVENLEDIDDASEEDETDHFIFNIALKIVDVHFKMTILRSSLEFQHEVAISEELSDADIHVRKKVVHVFNRFLSTFELNTAGLLSCAAERGLLPIIDYVVTEDSQIKDIDKACAIVYAARDGHLPVIERILSHGCTLSSDELAEALVHAVENGHEEIVRYFFSLEQYIKLADRSRALSAAVVKGYRKIFDVIMQETTDFTMSFYGPSIEAAARYKRFSMLTSLLSDPKRVDSDMLWRCIESAAKRDDLATLTRLYDKCPTFNKGSYLRALMIAAEDDLIDIFSFLFPKRKLCISVRDKLIIAAAKNWSNKILAYILPKGPIFSDTQVHIRSLLTSVHSGPILKILESVPTESRSALKKAV